MLALTAAPPPVNLGDDLLARLLNEDCDPDILAPPRPFVVPHCCKGNKALMDTFDRLHFLTLIHTDAERTDFTSAEIADVWPGGRTNRQSEYLHALCDLGLVQVIGHRAVPNLPSARHPAKFRIDLEHLRRASAPLVAAYIRRAGIAPPKRRVKPAPGQLLLALPPVEDDTRGTNGTLPPAAGSDQPHVGAVACPHSALPPVGDDASGTRRPLPPVGASDHQPQAGVVACPHSSLPPLGDDARGTSGPLPPLGESDHPPLRVVDTPQRPLSPEQGQSLPPIEGVVGGEVGKDVGKEVREERAEPAITRAVMNLDSIRAIMQAEIGQAIKEAIATHTLSPRTTFPLPLPETHELVPPPPPDEPAVDAGPRTTWVALVGRELTGRDGAQIAEHIRRYDAPSGGHSAYWLTRALVTASMQDDTPLTLNYAGGILRRMAKAGTWTTAELVRQPHETLREAAAPSPSPAEAAPPVARGKPRPSEVEKVAPSGPALPEHPAITAYTAAFHTKLNDVQRQQITVTITNLAAWAKVITEWQANGWKATAVAKMIDRYQKETGTAPASAAPLTNAIIVDHPDLTPEERSGWLTRFRFAPTPADKQAVLARFAKEYPDVRP